MIDRVFLTTFKLVTALVLIIITPVAMATGLDEPPAAFPQSSLDSSQAIQSSGHLVLFSPVREIRGEIRSEVMARLPVTGQGQLFEISRDSSRAAAREHYLRAVQTRGGQLLYECSGMACGRSNVWANQIFQQPGLLGRDNSQDYFVSAVADEEGRRWLTLIYTVTRGNLREYVWVEHLEVDAGAEIPGFQSVAARIMGPIVVPWQGGVTYRFDLSTTDRRGLVEWASDEGSEVVLAAFSALGADETLDEATDRAGQGGGFPGGGVE